MSIAEAIDIGVGTFRVEGTPEAQQRLFQELRDAQAEFDPVMEDATGQAGTRSFKYADYSSLIRSTRPYLVKHGIAMIQPLHSENGNAVTTTVLVGWGARITTSFSFKPSGNPQEFGRDHTYYRRYQLQSLLGLAGEDADDAKLSLAAKEKNGFTEASKATNGASKQPLQEPSKPAPQAAAPKAAPAQPKAVDEVKGTEEKAVDARPVNARIIDGMKQLGWNMDALKTFYKAEIDKKGFDKADNLPAPIKEKLYDLMVEKHKVARF